MTVQMALILAIMILLLPVITLILAGILSKKKPGEINRVVGYRTKRSMESQEAWDYANNRMTEIMKKLSIIMLIVSFMVGTVLFILYLMGNMTENMYTVIFTCLIFVQALLMCLPIPVIEKELAAGKHLKGSK